MHLRIPEDLTVAQRDCQVSNKAQNFMLWTTGAYGNRLRAWASFNDYVVDDFQGRVALRSRRGVAGPCVYNLHGLQQAMKAYTGLIKAGVTPASLMVNEMAPNKECLQGELWTGGDHPWYFLHSFHRAPMREALRYSSAVTQGLAARCLLKSMMTPSSFADLELLVEEFQDHVIELSVFDCCLGDIPGRNALVWEIRQY